MSRTYILYKALDLVSKLKIACLQECNFTHIEAAGVCCTFPGKVHLPFALIFLEWQQTMKVQFVIWVTEFFFIDCSETSLKGNSSSFWQHYGIAVITFAFMVSLSLWGIWVGTWKCCMYMCLIMRLAVLLLRAVLQKRVLTRKVCPRRENEDW